MLLIDIVRDGNGAVSFQPPVLLLNLGVGEVETVAFRNLDPQSSHWVTAEGKTQDFWFPRPLARHTGSSPNTSSRLVIVGTGQSFDIAYVCPLHQPAERGIIRV